MVGMRRIGELLVAEGLLSQAAVDRALGFQRLSGEHLKIGSILLDWDLLAEEALLSTLAKFHHCPAVDWATLSGADIEIVRLLASAQAARHSAIPYALERGTLRIAMVNPSDLSAIDELSAITGKRVVSGVSTEVRLMQAHQKFYGRHIPGHFRVIVQKLQRKTAQTRPLRESGTAVDFRASDLLQAAARPSVELPVVRSEIESLSPPELPMIDSPSLEKPIEPVPGSARHSGAPTSSDVEREDPTPAGEDSLSQWVGEALSAFQKEGASGGPGASRAEPSVPPPAKPLATAPRERPSPKKRDAFSGMWRPAPSRDSEEVATGMWTSGEEPGPQLWEARSRDEIGEAVLQNALTHLPRVLLFGAGKSAVTGWRGRGAGLTPEEIASVRIPAGARSVFTVVEESGVPHFGPVDGSEWPPALADLLGPEPPDCAVFPIRVLDGVAAFLYTDRLGQPMQYADFALIARAAASTANVLARFLRPNTAPVV